MNPPSPIRFLISKCLASFSTNRPFWPTLMLICMTMPWVCITPVSVCSSAVLCILFCLSWLIIFLGTLGLGLYWIMLGCWEVQGLKSQKNKDQKQHNFIFNDTPFETITSKQHFQDTPGHLLLS